MTSPSSSKHPECYVPGTSCPSALLCSLRAHEAQSATMKTGLLPEACPPTTAMGNCPQLLSNTEPLSAKGVQGLTHGFRNLPHPPVCAQVTAHPCSQDPARQSK